MLVAACRVDYPGPMRERAVADRRERQGEWTTRRAWLGLAVVFFCLACFGAVFQFVPPLLPTLIDQFSLSHRQAGLLMALFALPGVFVCLPGGLLVDRYGVRLTGVLGLGLMTVGSVGLALPIGFDLLLLARAVSGLGGMVAVVAMLRTVTRLFEGRPLGLPLGAVNTAVPVGIVCALNASGPAAEVLGWRPVALVVAGLGFVAWCLFMVLARRLPPGAGGDEATPDDLTAATRPHHSFRPVLIAGAVWLCANGAMSSFATFAPDHFLARGLDTVTRGFLTSLPLFGAVLLGPLLGWITDVCGGKRTFILTGMLLMTLSLPLVPLTWLPPLVVGLVLALAMSCLPTPLLTLPVDVLPPSHHGRAFGILAACANGGIVLVPPLAGAVRDASGQYTWPFLLLGAVAAVGLVTAWWLPRYLGFSRRR